MQEYQSMNILYYYYYVHLDDCEQFEELKALLSGCDGWNMMTTKCEDEKKIFYELKKACMHIHHRGCT